MPEVVEMDADLMRSPTVKRALQQAHVISGTQDTIFCFGGASLTSRNAHALPMHWMTRDRFVDHASALAQRPRHEGEINLGHGAGGELPGKIAMGCIVFRDHETAARFLVQAMHDPRPFLSSDARQIFAVRQQCVDQGMLLMAGTGMHHDPGGLVQHQQIVVLEKDLEGDLFRLGFDLFDLRFCEFDRVARSNRISRARTLPV
jgi:hypothetical protein